jgi:hypothetical protein
MLYHVHRTDAQDVCTTAVSSWSGCQVGLSVGRTNVIPDYAGPAALDCKGSQRPSQDQIPPAAALAAGCPHH